MDLPSNELINDRRISKFKQRISDTLADNDLSFFEELIDSYVQENDVPHNKVAAALAQLMQGDTPFLFLNKSPRNAHRSADSADKALASHRRSDSRRGSQHTNADDYRDGHKPAVRPTGIDSQYIGQIQIEADHSLVDLPEGMPKDIFNDLKKVRVCGFPMKISKVGKGKQAGFESPQDVSDGKKPKKTTKKKNKKPKNKTKKNKDKGKGKKRKSDTNSIV